MKYEKFKFHDQLKLASECFDFKFCIDIYFIFELSSN